MEDNDVIKVGAMAPDFVLKDQNGEEVRLSDMRGKKVLLSFHPMAWTGICADQMRSLEENMDRFDQMNTIPLGMSCDTVPSKLAWSKDLGIERLRMPSDFWPHGETAKAYGLFLEEKGFSNRVNVIIDEEGRVAWVKVYPIPQLPDIQEVLAQL